MHNQCQSCRKSPETLKRCASCSNAWYCDAACQKEDWPVHLLDCNINRPITTADYLGAAVCQDRAPVDVQTRKDYGFTRTPRPDDVEKRMKVYTLLIKNLSVKTKQIHQWREAGVLGGMMRHAFSTRLSDSQRQEKEHMWFTQHESTFGALPLQRDDSTNMWLLDAHHTARELISRTTTNAEFNRLSTIDGFDDCFTFFTLMLQGARPAPCDHTGLWVKFGFCGCSDQDEEAYLGNQYLFLFRAATFREFIDACTSSNILKLFSDKGKAIHNPHIQDALGDRHMAKSVWVLKEFACADDDMRKDSKPALPLCADYGFFNCKNNEEQECLRSVYKNILDRPGSDPLALHQACLRGELFGYCHQLVQLNPPDKFRRLMRNLYPLPDIEDAPETDLDQANAPAEHSTMGGSSSSGSEILGSQSTESYRVEQSDLGEMLQSAWQSQFK